MNSHVSGESFVLLSPGTLQEIVLAPTALGTPVSVKPRGLADDETAPVERIATGEAMRPPAPTDVLAERAADGGLLLRWTRRSRLGWLWPDGTELPLGESVEKYRVTLEGSAAALTYETLEPQLSISAEALGAFFGAVSVSVVQIGDFAQSRPISLSVDLAA